MADTNIKYAAAATIAMTNTSLADGAWRCSAEVDNGTNLYIDAIVSGNIQTGTLTADGSIDVYLIGQLADGVYFTAGIDASDKAITWGTTDRTTDNGEFQLRRIERIQTDGNADNQDVHFGPCSVAQAFGGTMPESWAVVIENNCGATTNATGTNNEISYFGVEFTVV